MRSDSLRVLFLVCRGPLEVGFLKRSSSCFRGLSVREVHGLSGTPGRTDGDFGFTGRVPECLLTRALTSVHSPVLALARAWRRGCDEAKISEETCLFTE